MAAIRRLDLPYSVKNIPLLSKFNYDKLYIYRAEDLVERMRWAIHWDKQKDKNKDYEKKETFNFRTTARAPPALELKEFEDDLFGLLKTVERRRVNDPFYIFSPS